MENRTSKYFKYAIGEIVLVVIGILIALQINNWNNKRIENSRAESFMHKMKVQLMDNISRVEKASDQLQNRDGITRKLMYIIGDNDKINIDGKIDSLVSVNMFDFHLNLNMNTLIEGRENGDLALIASDSLRQIIYDISTMYDSVKERERIANQDNIDLFIPYLNKRYNMRNGMISFFGQNRQIEKSKVYKGDNWKMLEDQEFENLINSRMVYNQDLLQQYKELHNILIITHGLLEK
jgi:hypothetical protein